MYVIFSVRRFVVTWHPLGTRIWRVPISAMTTRSIFPVTMHYSPVVVLIR